MLDIRFIRRSPEAVRSDLRKRGEEQKLELLEQLLKDDELYRKRLHEVELLRARRNTVTREISAAVKANDKRKADELKQEAAKIPDDIKAIEMELQVLEHKTKFALQRLPNVLHESVPIGKDTSENALVREWGKPKEFNYPLKVHGELAEEQGWADFDRAAKVSGAGFAYLLGDLALLDFALQQFALEHLIVKGFTPVQVPLMLDRKPYEAITDLHDFETMMYKLEGEEKYLIATSEHAIAAMHADEIFEPDDLPLRFAGVSPCFRREIGSHGVDTRGLFRTHQFNKVEQFVFCKQEDSWQIFEELIQNAEELYQQLELPYRVMAICTGDIGSVAAKKYDIELWMPREKEYKEAVSCSNCTDYQAVGLNVKYRLKKGGEEKEYAHTLNSTAIATSRTMRAILENYQQADGSVIVPNALRKYIGGIEKLRPLKRPQTT